MLDWMGVGGYNKIPCFRLKIMRKYVFFPEALNGAISNCLSNDKVVNQNNG